MTSKSDVSKNFENLLEVNQKAITDRYVSDTRDRKWLSKWAAIVITAWLFFVYVLLFINNTKIHLSDSVLIALITTTTINILGLPIVVLLNLFPKSEK